MSAYEQAQRTLDACRTWAPPPAEPLPLAVQTAAISEAHVYATLAVADELHSVVGALAATKTALDQLRVLIRDRP